MAEYIKCETCLYNKNCQFLAKHRNTIVEDCSAYKNVADVVEVVYGEWLIVEYNDGSVFKECSNCGARKQQRYYNFCSNCGAKMDGKGN